MLTHCRDAVRGLRNRKGFVALAVGILALTLSAGIVTFSVVDAVALRPLPFPAERDLVAIARLPQPNGNFEGATSSDYFAWRDNTVSFDGVAAGFLGVAQQIDGVSDEVTVARVTANLFSVLGVRPALGRLFTTEDERADTNILVLTDSVWRRSFSADTGVVGTRITAILRQTRVTYEIVGVLPPEVTYPIVAGKPIEAFQPYVATVADRNPANSSPSYGLHVVARLKRGIPIQSARADVARVTSLVRADFPQSDLRGGSTAVLPLQDRVAGRAKSWLLLALASVACLIVVGCVNATSLLLTRVTARTREFATRMALGASPNNIAIALVLEGVIIAGTATTIALLISLWGMGATRALLPQGLARISGIAIDQRVLIASVAAATLCGFIAGGLPAWRALRDRSVAIRHSGAGIIGGFAQFRVLGVFLTAQVAFVAVLLITTTLVVTSFVLVTTADLGFDRRGVVMLPVSQSLQSVPQEARRAYSEIFLNDLVARAEAVPNVRSVSFIGGGSAPLLGGSSRRSMEIPHRRSLGSLDMVELRGVAPNYFSSMGLRVVKGRGFDSGDRSGAAAVGLVNEYAASHYFRGIEPIGQIVTVHGPTRIVGIVQDVRLNGPESDVQPEFYVPFSQLPLPGTLRAQVVVRVAGRAAESAASIRESIRSHAAVGEPQFLEHAFNRLTAGRRFNASVMALFGTVAVILGALGVYCTMAFVVVQQTRVIGLQMALGASRAIVLRTILGRSLYWVGLGAILGLLGARFTSSLFSSLVFGVDATSPLAYSSVAVGLLLVCLIAAFVPAWRASRLDPFLALRAE